jgi:hypothetical protein
MKMKSYEKSLGHNPLTNVSYRNPGMVLNRQGPGHHPLGDALYLNLDMVLNEQGSGHRILIFRSNKMLDEWRWSILIPIFKNKGMCKVILIIEGSN